MPSRLRAFVLLPLLICGSVSSALAQGHEGMQMEMTPTPGWTFMQDGVVFLMFNDQGSARGGEQVRAPNWWMGMATHHLGRGTITFTGMLSLDPLTVGAHGYRHLFQAGETYNGDALIDYQHPHDFLMQAAAIWHEPLAHGFSMTVAGAPVGEPALGPVAYMHRSSSYENPISPLGHHTLDSTHISMGVVTGSVERGPFQVESSIFRGAEPDENRWDLMDPGALDSWSVRGWFRPTPSWTFQYSHGYLTRPEALEEGDVKRTTASVAWATHRDTGFTSVTLAWGRNRKLGGKYDEYLAEATRQYRSRTIFSRLEWTQVETDLLRTGVHTFQGGRKNAHVVLPGARDFVGAFTVGATQTVWRPHAWDVAIGGEITENVVPPNLSPFYGAHPWSGQIFLRTRPPSMHRMTDVIMTRHAMAP